MVRLSGILTLIAVYAQGTFTLLHYPNGLTASDLYLLDLTIIPNVMVLAFFSARSLLPIVCLNVVQIAAVLTYGPHNSDVASLLQTESLQIFAHLYILQLITALVLYFWARSTENAPTDQAQERAIYEMQEQERQMQELEKKRRLDDGIQQILQTHVAVANGDLNARAPLLRDHELWQVAGSLNNLIARFQSLSHTEHERKQQTRPHKKYTIKLQTPHEQPSGQYPKYELITALQSPHEQPSSQYPITALQPQYEQPSGQYPKYEPITTQQPQYEQPSGQYPKYEPIIAQQTQYEQTTDQYPINYEQITGQQPKYTPITAQQPKHKQFRKR